VERPFSFDNRQVRLLSSARRHELGCPSFAPIFALGAAVEYLGAIGIEAIAARVLELNLYLTFRLQRAGFEVLSPAGEHRSGQTLVALPRPREAAEFLQERGILVTRKREGVRISTHFFNNEEDIEACVNALVEQRTAPAVGH
jgi:selenocysteine lyase/cysteine desulfurase